ncbi:MAG: hypothetical protein IT204_11835 [Fimbriimonadaceae bacterium]|nr:hypothetical protein [Fimbriimonadaceae bacterium]
MTDKRSGQTTRRIDWWIWMTLALTASLAGAQGTSSPQTAAAGRYAADARLLTVPFAARREAGSRRPLDLIFPSRWQMWPPATDLTGRSAATAPAPGGTVSAWQTRNLR